MKSIKLYHLLCRGDGRGFYLALGPREALDAYAKDTWHCAFAEALNERLEGVEGVHAVECGFEALRARAEREWNR